MDSFQTSFFQDLIGYYYYTTNSILINIPGDGLTVVEGQRPAYLYIFIPLDYSTEVILCNVQFLFDNGANNPANVAVFNFNINSSDISITSLGSVAEPYFIYFNIPFTNGGTSTNYSYNGTSDSNSSSGSYSNLTSTPVLNTYYYEGAPSGVLINSGTFSDSIIKPRV